MNHLWISLSTYGGVTTRTALDVLWKAGIRQVELAIGVKPSRDTVAVLQEYGERGMQYRAHHAIVWQEHRAATQIPQGSFNLADSFDAAYFERLTDWLAAMQISAYSVHAGRIDANNADAQIAQFFEHLTQLAQLCRECLRQQRSSRSIRLGVETMYPTLLDHPQRYFMQNLAEIEQFLAIMPDVDLVIDLAHLNLWHDCSIPEKLQVLHSADDRLLELHISDNDGIRDNHTQISETTWWMPHVAHFPLDIPIVLESRMNGQTVEQIHQQVQRVQAIFAATIASPTFIAMGEQYD